LIKAVERKNPTLSEANRTKRIKDFEANIYLSKCQMFESLLAALVVKQNPNEHKKVPNIK